MSGNRQGAAAMSAGRIQGGAKLHRIRFGSECIDCVVRFGERDRLRISVHPDLQVTVDAPAGKALGDVLAKVKRRGGWIVKQRTFFEQFMPRLPEKRYVSGETFYYLGRQYRLRVAENQQTSVKLIGRFIRVHTRNRRDRKTVKGLVQRWYREHACAAFERRLDVCHETAKRYGIRRPQIKLRRMTRRWGSSKGRKGILLNTELVKAPVHCIDYVITHELCHLKFPNHSSGFYRLLSRCMPDWERRKARLERFSL